MVENEEMQSDYEEKLRQATFKLNQALLRRKEEYSDRQLLTQYQSFNLPAVVVRFIFRTLFVGSQIGLCELLLGGTGDTLLSLQSLAGAVGMAAFTYFLPFVCHWELMGEELGTAAKAMRVRVRVS